MSVQKKSYKFHGTTPTKAELDAETFRVANGQIAYYEGLLAGFPRMEADALKRVEKAQLELDILREQHAAAPAKIADAHRRIKELEESPVREKLVARATDLKSKLNRLLDEIRASGRNPQEVLREMGVDIQV